MEQEHLLILALLDEGKITVPEALNLIEAIDASQDASSTDVTPDASSPTLTVQLCLN